MDHNNVLAVDRDELQEKFLENIRRVTKKAVNIKRAANHSRRHFFEDLGIGNALPEENRRVYTLVGQVGTKEAHFV